MAENSRITKSPDSFDGVIFDLDGTLVRSDHVWSEIDRKFLAKRGFDVPEDYAEKISCLNFREGAVYTKQRFSLNENTEDIISEWFEMAVKEYRTTVKLIDGAADFIRYLSQAGKKIALATASSKELYSAALKSNGIYDYFDSFTSSEEVSRSKEFPDVYIFAAGRIGCTVSRCLVFEDIPKCAAAAASAGFYTIGIINSHADSDNNAMKSSCNEVFESYYELM